MLKRHRGWVLITIVHRNDITGTPSYPWQLKFDPGFCNINSKILKANAMYGKLMFSIELQRDEFVGNKQLQVRLRDKTQI